MLLFKSTSTATIDLTKSEDFQHRTSQKQQSNPMLETINGNLDDVNPIAPFRQHPWVAAADNLEMNHIVKKRCTNGCRSARHSHNHRRHHHSHHHSSNPYPNSMGNPYPNSMGNPYPNTWGNSYPNTWGNSYPNNWGNSNPNSWMNSYPIGIPPFQPRYRRSLSIFD
ncbi:unnamed protein product [Rotaria socialis]|uniref:Uncharacterized protein n=1 Tax=Rotaria socialis TaxID=392032 RepID=A0A820WK23_9BILA|nr:unnamed protein product [Rotaria socialis]CAF4519629.1 unnamed protein product [Rotaria socialis]